MPYKSMDLVIVSELYSILDAYPDIEKLKYQFKDIGCM